MYSYGAVFSQVPVGFINTFCFKHQLLLVFITVLMLYYSWLSIESLSGAILTHLIGSSFHLFVTICHYIIQYMYVI